MRISFLFYWSLKFRGTLKDSERLSSQFAISCVLEIRGQDQVLCLKPPVRFCDCENSDIPFPSLIFF